VVGVVLNLTVWFAVHVLFAQVSERLFGPLRLLVPDPAAFAWPAAALSVLAVALLFVWHRGIVATLGICGAVALLLHAA
jgi:chromate transporter